MLRKLNFESKGKQLDFKSLSGLDAQIIINELVKIIYGELMFADGPPLFKYEEINCFFKSLKYSENLRKDSITAVGAPSSLHFLLKAIYWLFCQAIVVHKAEECSKFVDN